MKHLVDEARNYERLRDQRQRCGLSWVEMITEIRINNAPHAGAVTHICSLRCNHADACFCACGATQLKNRKDV